MKKFTYQWFLNNDYRFKDLKTYKEFLAYFEDFINNNKSLLNNMVFIDDEDAERLFKAVETIKINSDARGELGFDTSYYQRLHIRFILDRQFTEDLQDED